MVAFVFLGKAGYSPLIFLGTSWLKGHKCNPLARQSLRWTEDSKILPLNLLVPPLMNILGSWFHHASYERKLMRFHGNCEERKSVLALASPIFGGTDWMLFMCFTVLHPCPPSLLQDDTWRCVFFSELRIAVSRFNQLRCLISESSETWLQMVLTAFEAMVSPCISHCLCFRHSSSFMKITSNHLITRSFTAQKFSDEHMDFAGLSLQVMVKLLPL